MKKYDYIISGGGAAGRSLLCRMLTSSLRDKHILLIDREPKRTNDRTWCFWETTPGYFEDIVFHSWKKLWVHTDTLSRLMDINPYTYKLIRGIDFYEYTNDIIARHPNVECIYGEVEAIKSEGTGAKVTVDGIVYGADWCFNSIFFGRIDKAQVNYLDQHFRGWFVHATSDVFHPGEATLMDFRTPQCDETRFLYVLPYSQREALVEVAIFSNNHLSAKAYDHILQNYLEQYFPQLKDFSIEQIEMGNIPMTDFSFPSQEGRIIHLGMAGGDTRASSGYTFFNIQRQAQEIVSCLLAGKTPHRQVNNSSRRAAFYDKLMLRVLEKDYHPGSDLFEKLFAKNNPATVLAFLNAETNVFLELQLVNSLPKKPFLKALIES